LDVVVKGGSLSVHRSLTIKQAQEKAIIDINQGKQNLITRVLREG
jgi:hypothetical protein